MLVLAVGLPKAGSSWFFNLVNSLLVAGGCSDAREIRNRYQLSDIVKFDECNIQEPTEEKLARLTSVPVAKHIFSVKTHSSPHDSILKRMVDDTVRVTFIYRDPRDMAVAALEAGEKLRNRGVFEKFGRLRNMDEAILWSAERVKDEWLKWSRIEPVLRVRYEDLLAETEKELQRVEAFLDIKVTNNSLDEVVREHSRETLIRQKSNRYHFNQGVVGRYKRLMTPDQITLCQQLYGNHLQTMGYR